MKINCVYDFIPPDGKIPNGFDVSHINLLFDYNFFLSSDEFRTKLKEKTQKQFWEFGILSTLDIVDISVSELTINDSEIYIYPITTSGDYLNSLSIINNEPSIFYYISEESKKLQKHKNFYYLLEHPGEPYFDTDILKKIVDDCNEYGIDISKLIIVNGCGSNDIILEEFYHDYKGEQNIRLCNYTWPIPFKSIELRSRLGLEENENSKNSTISDITHINLPKTKKALLLNRRLRLHRLIFLSMLAEKKLLDSTLHSYDMELNTFTNFKEIINGEDGDIEFNIPINEISNIINGYNELTIRKKSILDFDELDKVHGYGMETKELYEQTFFSIVTETEYSYHQQSFTEKIIKPIMHCHPFVLISSPNILKQLKQYGFKTFDKWWDESYDSEYDNYTRMKMVLKLLDLLLNKSNDEWYSMLIEMKDILEYNRNLLISFSEDTVSEMIYNNLKNIIDNNSNTLF